MSMGIIVKVWYGGRFLGVGDSEDYVGGSSDIVKGIDTNTLTLFDFEYLVTDYGYSKDVLKFWKFPNTDIRFRHPLAKDRDLVDMIEMLRDGETVEVFFEDVSGQENLQMIRIPEDEEPLQAVTESVTVSLSPDDQIPPLEPGENVVKPSQQGVDPVDDAPDPIVSPNESIHEDDQIGQEDEALGRFPPPTSNARSESSEELTDFSDVDIGLDREDLFCETEDDISRVHEHVQHSIDEIDIETHETRDFDEEDATYVPSDELLTASDSRSELDGEGRIRYPIFNEKTGFGKTIDISVGMQFRNRDVFRRALTEYVIRHGFDFDYVNNCSWRISAQCRADDCPWRIRASLVKEVNGSSYFQIKGMVPHENCGRDFHNSRVTAKFLAERYLESFRDNPSWSVDAFCKQHVKREFEVDVSYHKCYNARKHALQLLEGAKGEQYKLLRNYGAALCKWNPESSFKLTTTEGRFQRVYICLAAYKRGFIGGCRPIISLDACHLKGAYTGQIHSVVGRDGNENMFPIAYAICESESKSTWLWFIQNLLNDLGNSREGNWCFISDQQKGLEEALKELAPEAEHRFCVRHLYANFGKIYKGNELKDAMWACAKAATHGQFLSAMDVVKALDVNAYNYLLKLKPAAWSRHAFSLHVKSDALCSNISKCFNSYIKQARDKPIITCLETIRKLLMKRFHDKRTGMEKMNTTICPRISRKLQDNQRGAMHCDAVFSSESVVQVNHTVLGDFRVDLHLRSCSCGVWDLTGIPCLHGCAAILRRRRKHADFLHRWYKKDLFLTAYNGSVAPLPGPSEWPREDGEEIMPPLYKRQAGRPKKIRMRPVSEPRDPRRKRKMGERKSCGLCKGVGHNKRNCPNRDNADPKRLAQSVKDAARAAKNRLKNKQPSSDTQNSRTINDGTVKKAKPRRKKVVQVQPELNDR